MPRLLVIEASPRNNQSISRALTARFVDRWRDLHPNGEVIRRDLSTTQFAPVDMAYILGAFTPSDTHSPESAAALKMSNTLVAELLSADFVLIGTPMHNLAVPVSLKAYIDHIIRIGLTVSDQNEGLVAGKRAALLVASGSDFSPGSPARHLDYLSPYLRVVLAFIGITDLQLVQAGPTKSIMEGQEDTASFLDRFTPQVEAIAASWAPAAVA